MTEKIVSYKTLSNILQAMPARQVKEIGKEMELEVPCFKSSIIPVLLGIFREDGEVQIESILYQKHETTGKKRVRDVGNDTKVQPKKVKRIQNENENENEEKEEDEDEEDEDEEKHQMLIEGKIIPLPAYVFLFDSEVINTIFAIAKVDGIIGNGEVWLKEGYFFQKQLEKVTTVNDYEWSFLFQNFHNPKASAAQGSWEIADMVPVTLFNLPYFKKLFEEEKIMDMYKEIKDELDFEDSKVLSETKKKQFTFPKLPNESDWIVKKKSRGRPRGSGNKGEKKATSSTRKKQKRRKWTFEEEMAIVKAREEKGNKWQSVLNYIKSNWHYLNDVDDKEKVRKHYIRMKEKYIVNRTEYEIKPFVRPDDVEDSQEVEKLESEWVKQEADNKMELDEAVKKMIEMEKKEILADSSEILTTNQLIERLRKGKEERKKHQSARNEKLMRMVENEAMQTNEMNKNFSRSNEIRIKEVELRKEQIVIQREEMQFTKFVQLRDYYGQMDEYKVDHTVLAKSFGIDLRKLGISKK